MRYIVYFILILSLLVIETVGLGTLFGFRPLPDLVLLYTLILVCQNDKGFYFFAIFSAIYLDFYISLYPGTYLISFLLIIFLIRVVFDKFIFSEKPARYLLLIVMATTVFLYYWAYLYNLLVFTLRFVPEMRFVTLPIRVQISQVLIHLVFLYPVYMLNQFVQEKLERFEQRRSLV